MRRTVDTQCERHVMARVRADTETFAHQIVIDRNKRAYPDPPLTHVSDDALSQYHRRLTSFRHEYTPTDDHEHSEKKAFYEREQVRCNIERGKRAFPDDLHELLPDKVASFFERLSFDTGYGISLKGRSMDWNAYHRLCNDISLDHLRTYAAYKAVHGQTLVDRNKPRLVNAIRYIRGDPTVSLDNIIDFVPLDEVRDEIDLKIDGESVELQRGIPYNVVKERLRAIVDAHPTPPVALALANIGKAWNYTHPDMSADGSQNMFRVNFANVADDEKQDVVAHEFFHSLQEVLGVADMAATGEWVNHDAAPDDWTPVAFHVDDVHPHIKRLRKRIVTHWHKVRCEFRGLVRPYQAKNPNELTAVAFETYIADPDTLKETQPALYETIERCLESPAASARREQASERRTATAGR